jgi:hypothetical protein
MPTISVFYGIMIRMFFSDHPPAHFHAIYGEFQATIEIEELRVLRASFRVVRWSWSLSGLSFTGKNCWRTGSVAGTSSGR